MLGGIENKKMQLNECGEIIEKCWKELPKRFSQIQLEQFIIMPNHIHAIIVINDFNVGVGLALPSDTTPMVMSETSEGKASLAPTITNKYKANNEKRKTIGDVVRVLKSISAIKINKYLNRLGVPVWQRNYYEHIIRNEAELYKIVEYIINNPINWQDDENYV
ncbi:MAG: transposase [bacterium]